MDTRTGEAEGSTRRRFLMATGAAVMAGTPIGAIAGVIEERERRLSIQNVRTGEELDLAYWTGGQYSGSALARFNWLLRDFRVDEATPIHAGLLDLMYFTRRALGTEAPYAVISGYRSAETNRLLARRNKRVAKNSFHIKGMAVDLCLPGRDLAVLAETATSFRLGGVGYYPRQNFVHLDVGGVRSW